MGSLLIDSLTAGYNPQHPVIDRFSWHTADAEYVHVRGASGCGKTTLFKAIAGLVPTQYDALEVNGVGVDPATPPHDRPCALMFQRSSLWPHMSAWRNITTVWQRSEIDEAALRAWTARLNIDSRLHERPWRLSGGEQQRVEFMRTLAVARPVLLLDEPFAFQDPRMIEQMCLILREYQQRRQAVVLIASHTTVPLASLPEAVPMNLG